VSWHSFEEHALVTSSDDQKLLFWDIRQPAASGQIEAHGEEINSVDFNKHNDCLLASGSRDKTVAIWDRRNLQSKLMSLDYHENQVLKVAWSPFNGTCLATSSSDRRICIWDISQID
jgi:histone-binding protein RBBP4